jgi:hypothetical protein
MKSIPDIQSLADLVCVDFLLLCVTSLVVHFSRVRGSLVVRRIVSQRFYRMKQYFWRGDAGATFFLQYLILICCFVISIDTQRKTSLNAEKCFPTGAPVLGSDLKFATHPFRGYNSCFYIESQTFLESGMESVFGSRFENCPKGTISSNSQEI